MRNWQLDLYIGLSGVTPLAVLWLSYWAISGYSS